MTVQHRLYTQWWKKNNTTMTKYLATKSQGLWGVLLASSCHGWLFFSFSYYSVDYIMITLCVLLWLFHFLSLSFFHTFFFCGHVCLFPPIVERYRRSFLPAAVRLYNQHCSLQTSPCTLHCAICLYKTHFCFWWSISLTPIFIICI